MTCTLKNWQTFFFIFWPILFTLRAWPVLCLKLSWPIIIFFLYMPCTLRKIGKQRYYYYWHGINSHHCVQDCTQDGILNVYCFTVNVKWIINTQQDNKHGTCFLYYWSAGMYKTYPKPEWRWWWWLLSTEERDLLHSSFPDWSGLENSCSRAWEQQHLPILVSLVLPQLEGNFMHSSCRQLLDSSFCLKFLTHSSYCNLTLPWLQLKLL